MVDFLSEFTRSYSVLNGENPREDSWVTPVWKLFVDDSTNQEGSGIRIILESPKQEKMLKALKLGFPVSNNEAEYEVLLTGLKMGRELGVRAIRVFCDSKLVSAQINTEFQAREPRMAFYLQLAQNIISCFESFEITHIPRMENLEADQLARVRSGIDKNSEHHVDILLSPSTGGTSVNQIDEVPTWMTPIIGYLLRGELPQDKVEAQTLRM